MATRRVKGEGSVYQRKADGRWIGAITVGYTEHGRQHRKTVSAGSAQEALKKLKVVVKQRDEGLPPPDDKMTVAQLLDSWLQDVHRHRVAPSAYASADWAVRVHLTPAIGKVRVNKLTPHDLDRLMSQKIGDGLSSSSVRRIRSVLQQGLDQGVKWGIVPRNVVKLTQGPKLVSKEGRSLTAEQAQNLLASLKGDRLEALYVVMLSLGLRRGEALGLKWSDLDSEKGTLTIARALKEEDGRLVLGNVKTAKSRRSLNLTDQAAKALNAHKARQAAERLKAELWRDSGLIFTTEIGTPIDPHNFNREFRKVCEKAGLGQTPEQTQKVLAAVKGHRLEALYVVALSLNLRRGMALGLKWTDLDSKMHSLTVQRTLKREGGEIVFGEIKSEKSRRSLDLPQHVTKALSRHKTRQEAEQLNAGDAWQNSGLIFTTEIGAAIDPNRFNREFRAVCEQVGVGQWHPHELRHSAASLMIQAEVPIEVVRDVLGHSSIRMTVDTYGHIREPQRQKAADAMTKVLSGQTE